VVGQYKTKQFTGLSWKLEVEFADQLGLKYGFGQRKFGDEARNPLLACLCVDRPTRLREASSESFLVLPTRAGSFPASF
jgi:hypothetical protein